MLVRVVRAMLWKHSCRQCCHCQMGEIDIEQYTWNILLFPRGMSMKIRYTYIRGKNWHTTQNFITKLKWQWIRYPLLGRPVLGRLGKQKGALESHFFENFCYLSSLLPLLSPSPLRISLPKTMLLGTPPCPWVTPSLCVLGQMVRVPLS